MYELYLRKHKFRGTNMKNQRIRREGRKNNVKIVTTWF
jgi:hypothetical protein